MMENTLAVLYRYIPLQWSKVRNSRSPSYFLDVVNATGQVGLQGQKIASEILGKYLKQDLNKGIGPTPRLENTEVTFDNFRCFDTTLPPIHENRSHHPERFFKDIAMLVLVVYDQFKSKFESLVKDMKNVSFKADQPLSVNGARDKRNQIYEKLGGRGNPWSHVSWNFKKMKREKKRCQPELGWKACRSITDYLSGTIECTDIKGLQDVWNKVKDLSEKVDKNKWNLNSVPEVDSNEEKVLCAREEVDDNRIFKVLKVINKLGTVSRDMICIGKFNINPPINWWFDEIAEHMTINVIPVTIRIRWVLTINGKKTQLDNYNHFELARKNYLLSSLYSPEQLFTPRICNYEKDLEKEKDNLIKRLYRRKPRRRRLSVKAASKRICPSKHPLSPVPAFENDLSCGVCGRGVEKNQIVWFCGLCNWLCCDCAYSCQPDRGISSRKLQRGLKHGSSINFNSAERGHAPGSGSTIFNEDGLYRMYESRTIKLLQEELKDSDQRVRDLELHIAMSKRNPDLHNLDGSDYEDSVIKMQHEEESQNVVDESKEPFIKHKKTRSFYV